MPLPSRAELIERARELRRRTTDAETLLWWCLRSRQVHGIKFRRQHPISPYVVDFYSEEANLVIEVDGSQHFEEDRPERDAERTEFLAAFGLRVLRFTNVEVLRETEAVLAVIWEELDRIFPSPWLSSQ